MSKMTYEQALNRLAVYCSRAERCQADIRRKMDLWEISDTEQKKIIQYLRQEKFLDESRYCRAFVNDKIKYNRWGIHKIKYELAKKQVSEILIREALENIDSEENLRQLRLLIEQKRKSVQGKNDFEVNQKLIHFAASRGYSLQDIGRVLKDGD
ncbi:regulatory protein RecX [Bacteroidia bacterium]|nr:regulatory protein RecX [Bacteroidia bacterium]